MSALIDGSTRYRDDPRCRYVVAAHPDGLSRDQVGELLGVSREAVWQIEVQALESLRRRMRLAGVRAEDLGEAIALRARREAV